MLGAINRQLNNIKYLGSKKVQKLPLSERLKIATKGTTDAFKGESVHLSSGVTNMPPPLEQEETFIETPPQVAEKPQQKETNLPVSIKDNTTGQNFQLQQSGNGPALAMLPEETSEINTNSTPPPLPKEAKAEPHHFRDGIEFVADGVNIGVGGIAGAVFGGGLVATLTGAAVLSGPIGLAAAIAVGSGAGLGFLGGAKLGQKLGNLSGKAGAWISKKFGGDEEKGRVIGKSALALGITTPSGLSPFVGGGMLSTGLLNKGVKEYREGK